MFNSSKLQTQVFKVKNMVCASCSLKLKQYITPTKGIVSVNANHISNEVTVVFDTRQITDEAIKKQLKELGYPVDTLKSNLKLIDYSINSMESYDK